MTKENLGSLILAAERQMYVTAKSILKDDNDCADAIQNAIVKAFMKRHSLKNEAYAKTWLIRIVINECYSILRSSRKIVSLEECKEVNDTYAEDKKDYGELYAAVRHLKDDLRMVVVLYYIEEFSCKEIAAILEISEGAVQKRLARARAKMKEELTSLEVASI